MSSYRGNVQPELGTSFAKVLVSEGRWRLQVRIDIYEGESKKATENKLLDTFTLSGIPPLPAGEPRILVRFKVDFDGTLSASAHDRTPG